MINQRAYKAFLAKYIYEYTKLQLFWKLLILKMKIFVSWLNKKFYFCSIIINFQELMSSSNEDIIKIPQNQLIELVSVKSSSSPFAGIKEQVGDAQLIKLKGMEGECRILQFHLLKVNYFKAIFFTFLMIISVFGLLLLKYYKTLRVLLFYSKLHSSQIKEATHIYVKGTDKNQSICALSSCKVKLVAKKVFLFKHLKYEYLNQMCIPMGFRVIDQIKNYQDNILETGLNSEQIRQSHQYYGKNEHLVEVPNYFQYIFDVMTKPFFVFQYIVSIIWILQNLPMFGILMIIVGFITTSINYVLLYLSYKKVKETAEKQYQITVLRDGQFKPLKNVDLVCGDIFVPSGQIPCDAILLKGQLFIDESGLTGESVPIPKFKLVDNTKVLNKSHWIYEGSKVKTIKEGTLALAVDLGFGSQRGKIIRKILTKIPKQPEFFKKLTYFLIQILAVNFILYCATVSQLFELDIETIMIIFRALDFITYSFPATLPIYFNLAYSFCLIRLSRDGIYGTESEKTIEGSRLKTICFDKTGTLTQSGMKLANIYQVNREGQIKECAGKNIDSKSILDIFACCNSVERINGIYQGDEIDLKMFEHVKANIAEMSTLQIPHNIIRTIKIGEEVKQIIKINEYQSRFQSMSVMFWCEKAQKYFVAVKGNPQMIYQYAAKKVNGFEQFIKQLSLEGYRSIAFGYKQVDERQVKAYMNSDRQYFLKSNNLLGIVAFNNQLKQDAIQTIKTLTQCDINTKIITGDNIFLGVQTAFLTGMIEKGMKVIVVEGEKGSQNSQFVTELTKNQKGEIKQTQRKIENFEFQGSQGVVYAIDNDYIIKNPNTFLHDKIKIFARISPQNKALIVKKHKQIIKQQLRNRTLVQKIFGECSMKVGMVGDGANDLIAIKDADIGIGISSGDAVYSASFSIANLSQIIELICESRNTERQIIEICRFTMLVNLINIVNTLILSNDASYNPSMQQIYINFITVIPLTIFYGLCRPEKKLSKYMPASNFMGLENHLVIWILGAILAVGQYISYRYYSNSDDFEANPNPKVTFANGWNGVCKSSTICFLIMDFYFTSLNLILCKSSPWKQPIFKNKSLLILIIINFTLGVSFFFTTEYLGFLDMKNIALKEAGVILGICISTCTLCEIVNSAIQHLKLYEKPQHHEKQNRQAKPQIRII